MGAARSRHQMQFAVEDFCGEVFGCREHVGTGCALARSLACHSARLAGRRLRDRTGCTGNTETRNSV